MLCLHKLALGKLQSEQQPSQHLKEVRTFSIALRAFHPKSRFCFCEKFLQLELFFQHISQFSPAGKQSFYPGKSYHAVFQVLNKTDNLGIFFLSFYRYVSNRN